MENTTITSLFTAQVESSADRCAVMVKRDGKYAAITWLELQQDVFRAMDVFHQHGVQVGDRVAQISENRYEWIVTDLAIQSLGAIHVPMHATLTAKQLVDQLVDCTPKCLVVSGIHPEAKIPDSDRQLAAVSAFSYDPNGSLTESTRPWSETMQQGDAARGRALYASRAPEIQPSTLATLLYTSGTTGESKGVMLTQGNFTSNALACMQIFGDASDDLRLNFLPLSHIFARTCDLYTWIASGCRLALAESRETIIPDCLAVHPTLLNGVPYFFDRTMRFLQSTGADAQPDSLRNLLGGQIRFCCSGGAALADSVFDFYQSQGLALIQGYGLTESSPCICVSTPDDNQRGSVGRPIPGVEVRIADDGEVLTRGPHVMLGYWNKPEATAEVLRDGWLYTGDIGQLDANGRLSITGRKKEIIVTAGGKNVAPVLLENLLSEDPLILQAMVIGDDRKYLAALLVPDLDMLRQQIDSENIAVDGEETLLTHDRVRAIFGQIVQDRLADVSHYEQIQRFTLLDRGFSIEAGEMTPKLSLRRAVISRNFAQEIEAMYTENVS